MKMSQPVSTLALAWSQCFASHAAQPRSQHGQTQVHTGLRQNAEETKPVLRAAAAKSVAK